MISIGQFGRLVLGTGVMAALLVSGCRVGPHDDNGASVRLINAVPDAGGLDVSVDGKRVWSREQFRGSTGFKNIAAGTYPVQIDADGPGTTLLTKSLVLGKKQCYTLLALGQAGRGGVPARVQVLPEEARAALPPGKASLRLINAAPGIVSADLVVNTIVGLKAVGYGRRSVPLLLAGGHYTVELAVPGTAEMLTGGVGLDLAPGQAYTLIAMGQARNQSLRLEVYPDK